MFSNVIDIPSDSRLPLLQNSITVQEQRCQRTTMAIHLSLAANVTLLNVKALTFWYSHSMAVLASMVDSIVDLLSQAVISYADYAMTRQDPRFPAGKARLEALSVVGCAAIMTVGAAQVISDSARQLVKGLGKGKLLQVEMGPLLYCILGAATVVKFVLWCYCFLLRHHSAAALALAEDHINDVVSNIGAIITAAIASRYRRYWWTDPAGGIGISFYVALRWAAITKHQVDNIVGKTAPAEFLAALRELACQHHPLTSVGHLRAYHSGHRLVVDVELAAPAHMKLAQLGPIAQELKWKIEAFPEVDCAAVFLVPQPPPAAAPHTLGEHPPCSAFEPHSVATLLAMKEWLEGFGDMGKSQSGSEEEEGQRGAEALVQDE